MQILKLDDIDNITIEIGTVTGTLRIKGWDRSEFRADPDDPDALTVNHNGNTISMECDSGCLLRIPTYSNVKIKDVGKDLQIKTIEGELSIGQINGSLTAKNLGPTRIAYLNGHANIRHVEGPLHIEDINGHAMLRDVEGAVEVDKCNGNINYRGSVDQITASADGNIIMRLEPNLDKTTELKARGNISLRMISIFDGQVKMHSNANAIRVQTDEINELFKQADYEIEGTPGAGTIHLEARGRIDFINTSEKTEREDEFTFEFEEDFSNMAEEIAQQINEQVESQIESITDRINEITTSISANFDSNDERVRRRLEHKRQALERKLAAKRRDIQRKAQRQARAAIYRRGGSHRERRRDEAVSDEERMKILKMVADKQIGIDEAEMLLAALEGREFSSTKSAPSEESEE